MRIKVALLCVILCLVIGCRSPHVEITTRDHDNVVVEEFTSELSKETDVVEELDEELEQIKKDKVLIINEIEDEVDKVEEVTIEKLEKNYELPEGFVYLDDVVPYAQYDIRYHTENNFVGEPIEGYVSSLAIGTKQMAEALSKVSEELYAQGYILLIYDAYRPAKAVSFFKLWAQTDDIKMKEHYYPNENKTDLFKKGYLASRSGHSRGSTVDLTLMYKDTLQLVDMGSDYDLLDEISSFNTKNITSEQASHRNILKDVMIKHGFKAYSKEWWHYVLKNEPYPDTYFDFDVE